MKKKILHVAQCNGGVSKYLKMFFKYSNKAEFENIFIGSKLYKDEEKKFIELVDKMYLIDMIRELSLGKDLKSIIAIRKLIKETNPDIIYAHSSKAGALVRIATRLSIRKIPCVYNPHGWSFNMKTSDKKRNMYYIIEKILSRFTNKIIAISEFEKISALNRNLCPHNKIDVIWNGIDMEQNVIEYDINSIKDEMNIPKNSYVIGMVGRISKQKAPDTFVKVAKKVKEKIPNAYFLIIGDGEDRNSIENMIKKEGLENCFKITGWVENTYKYISIFDVATLMSRWEGFGLVLAEYMIMRKPIVATRVDAIPNLIEDKVNGYLADVDNIDMIFQGIIKIKEDENFKNRIIKNSYYKVINKFNIKNTVKAHEILFKNLLNG